MTNLGSTNTPAAAQSLELPNGYAPAIEESSGDLVINDTNGNTVLRWDDTNGKWKLAAALDADGNDVTNVGALGAEKANIDNVTVPEKTVRVFPKGDASTYFDATVTEQGSSADLIPTLQDINDNQLAGQGAVKIGPGDYWVQDGDTLSWSINADIRGSGREATVIRRVSSTTGYLISNTANGVTVADLTLNGNSGGEHALQHDNARNCSTERVNIFNWGGRAFELKGSTYWHTARTVFVSQNNQSGLVDQQVRGNNDGNGPQVAVWISCRIERGNDCAGVRQEECGDWTWIGGIIENNDGAGMKTAAAHGLYIDGLRFEGNNQSSTTESRFSEQAELVIAQGGAFTGFRVSGRFSAGPNLNANILLGDNAAAEGGQIVGSRFSNNSTGTGADIQDQTIGGAGVWIGPNNHAANNVVNNRANGILVMGVGEENAGVGNLPTAADWPIGSTVVNDDDGAVYQLNLLSGWQQLQPIEKRDLSGDTGAADGQRALDDGTNTANQGLLCLWDGTNQAWQPMDGGATFT